MKFIIHTQEFNYLINKCLNIAPAKPSIPILSNILITAANGLITLTATDTNVSICCSSETQVLEEGSTTVPAKKLSQLVNELTSTTMEFSTDTNDLSIIVADSSRFRINGMNASAFPQLPELHGAFHIKFKQSTLKTALYRTVFAVSKDMNRMTLTGVLMQIAGSQATFIGADGQRLSRMHIPLDIDPQYNKSLIIPLKAIEEFIKNLNGEEDVQLYLMDDKIAMQTDRVTIVTKLVPGEYPDVNRVIPGSVEHLVSIHREELVTLLRQVTLFTNVERHIVRFSFCNGELKLSANTSEIGEGRVSMPVNYHGNDLEIAFNPTYFLDVLRHVDEESVMMGLCDSFTPGVITDQKMTRYHPEETSSLFMLMPMRLDED